MNGKKETVTGERLAAPGLPSVAQRYIERWLAPEERYGGGISRLADACVRIDERYCRWVAGYYDRAPAMACDDDLRRRYDRFKSETLRQYEAVVGAGISVRPWLGEGQPYRNSRELRDAVRRSGELRVLLTVAAHGPSPAEGPHPLREPSGVRVDGVEFCYNDLFRAVHDVFGHLMLGTSFGPEGEFLAGLCQMRMYSTGVHTVLFTEHVAQICWFFYGPHVAQAPKPSGGPPDRRPYPEQKVFAFPARLVDAFPSMFQWRGSTDA
ncbi:hypothetical protein GCM10029978_055220 [Actinoallomurus acanthiterrae]